MPPRRKRPVLYEIVRHTRRPSDVGWRDPRHDADRPSRPAVERPGPALHTSPPAAAESSSANEAIRTASAVRFVDGRLLVDLAWPGITATALMVVVLLGLAFQAGKRSAASAEPDPIEQTVEQTIAAAAPDPASLLPPELRPPARDLPAPRPAERVQVPVAPAPRAAEPRPEPAPPEPPPQQETQPAFSFQPGYHYVVVQHFRLEHKDAAFDAARFLQANGVDAVVVVKKADVEVVATTPFLLKQDNRAARAAAQKACDALKEKIRTLGREFAKQQAAAKRPQYALDQPAERLRLK